MLAQLYFNIRHLLLPVARFENRQAGVCCRAGQRIAHKSWPMHKATGFTVTDGFCNLARGECGGKGHCAAG
ncbi:Uncharacterised protein [Shigella sonnei]|nr:Uncharacterised protein [Shigella sonnei]